MWLFEEATRGKNTLTLRKVITWGVVLLVPNLEMKAKTERKWLTLLNTHTLRPPPPQPSRGASLHKQLHLKHFSCTFILETSHVASTELITWTSNTPLALEKWKNENILPVRAKDFPPFVKKWNLPGYLLQIQLLGVLCLLWDLHSHVDNIRNWKKGAVMMGQRGLAVDKCGGWHRRPGDQCDLYFWPARRARRTFAALTLCEPLLSDHDETFIRGGILYVLLFTE